MKHIGDMVVEAAQLLRTWVMTPCSIVGGVHAGSIVATDKVVKLVLEMDIEDPEEQGIHGHN